MTSENLNPEKVGPAQASVLQAQREANERLILAAIRAEDDAESAHGAHLVAEAEAELLRNQTHELRSIAALRERLIGIIAHDLRNPLNSVVMAATLLRDEPGASSSTRRLAERIVQSGGRMGRMVDELVDFTRMRFGADLQLNLEVLDLSEVCLEILEEFRVGARTEIVFLESASVFGYWDRDRLCQLISNLVGNAVEHAAPASQVIIEVRHEGERGVFRVSNRGAPIPPDALPFIFELFRRVAGRPLGKHLGLGLFIADQIARAHKGVIEVESNSSSTTFTVRLPLAPPH
jgi:signal transduction histidine kinase